MSRSAADPLDPGPAGFAHRGLHGPDVPENSLASLSAALACGAGFETDLRLSADGVPMVFHDIDAIRMCGSPAIFSGTPAAELAALHLLGTQERVPTLAQLLELDAGRIPLLLELKSEANAARFAAAVAGLLEQYEGPAGVMSFDPFVGRWLARRAPRVRRGLVLSDKDPAAVRIAKMTIARPQFLAVKHSELGRPWVARARRRMPVYSWTIRDADQRRQAAVHADALIWEADGRP